MKSPSLSRGLCLTQIAPKRGLLFLERGRALLDDRPVSATAHATDASHRVAFPKGVSRGVAELADFATDLATAHAGRTLGALDQPVVAAYGLLELFSDLLNDGGFHLPPPPIQVLVPAPPPACL